MGWVPKENGLSECESSELLVWDYIFVSLSDFSLVFQELLNTSRW